MRGTAQRPDASSRAGWTLVAAIILLTVALIVLFGVGSAVAQGVRASLVGFNGTKALYLAHAGIMDAIASYRPGNTASDEFALGCFGNDPGDLTCDNSPALNFGVREVFVRAPGNPQRDFLLIDMSNESVNPTLTRRTSQSTFDNWELRKVSSNATISITGLEVRWTGWNPASGQRVTRVCLNANWNAAPPNCLSVSAQSGELIPISSIPASIITGNAWNTNTHILFNFRLDALPNPVVITLTFRLSDSAGCTNPDAPLPDAPTSANLNTIQQAMLTEECRRTAVWVRGAAFNVWNWGLFTVRSAGEVRSNPFTARRRLRSEYRARATVASQRNQIVSWDEE